MILTTNSRHLRPSSAEKNKSLRDSYYDKSWALVVGINDYDGRHPTLSNARNDAGAVAKLLRADYDFDEVFTLFDDEATYATLMEWLRDRLAAKVGPDDRVVVFFAGHGTTRESIQGEKRGYLVPYDAAEGKFSNYVDMSEVRDACGWIQAKHIFIILDCCFSGIAAISARSTPATHVEPFTDSYLSRITERSCWQVLCAGASDELAADSGDRPGHSAFTGALLSGLEGQADQNGDGIITATELAGYVKPEVSRSTAQGRSSGQTPFFNYLAGSDQGDFVFLRPDREVKIEPADSLSHPLRNIIQRPVWMMAALSLIVTAVALTWWLFPPSFLPEIGELASSWGIDAAEATGAPAPTPPARADGGEPSVGSTSTPIDAPLYSSGLITYIREDGDTKRLNALQQGGTSVTLIEGVADVKVLDVSPDRNFLAVATSAEGVISAHDEDYPLFVSGPALTLRVISADGRTSKTVFSDTSPLSATYSPDGRLIVARIEDDETRLVITQSERDGSGQIELHSAGNAPSRPKPMSAPAAEDEGEGVPAARSDELRLFSALTLDDGADALWPFYEIFSEEFPDVDIINLGLEEDNPPTEDMWEPLLYSLLYAGELDLAQLQYYDLLEDEAIAELMVPLVDYLQAEAWPIPEDLPDIISQNDPVRMLPFGVHRTNGLWIRPEKLLAVGIERPPATWDEFFHVAEKLEEAGMPALGMAEFRSGLSAQVFTSILVAMLGPSDYRGLFDGSTSWADPRITQSLEILSRIYDYANPDYEATTSFDLYERFSAEDGPAMLIAGDWIRDFWRSQDFDAYAWSPAPGTETTFVVAAHTVALPKDSPNPENAHDFLYVVASREGQDAFNPLHGSIPARMDADLSLYDAYQRDAIEALATDELVPSIQYGLIANKRFVTGYERVLHEFALGRDLIDVHKSLIEVAADAGFDE